MKRDTNLIRRILEHVERSAPSQRGFVLASDIPGTDQEVVKYHFRLCNEAGFVRVTPEGNITELTWHGHETLKEMRSESHQDAV